MQVIFEKIRAAREQGEEEEDGPINKRRKAPAVPRAGVLWENRLHSFSQLAENPGQPWIISDPGEP